MGTGKTIVSIVAANRLDFGAFWWYVRPISGRHRLKKLGPGRRSGHLIIPVKANSQYDANVLATLTSGWVIINYDILSRRPEIKARSWDLLIVNKSHLLKNFIGEANMQDFWREALKGSVSRLSPPIRLSYFRALHF